MPWGQKEKTSWFKQQTKIRSYKDDVVNRISNLAPFYSIQQYGTLNVEEAAYPLFLLKSKNWSSQKPTALITGGVHGYETSGVHGAIGFLETSAKKYDSNFNIICVPCMSPWSYETINRWNAQAIDPNRSFLPDSPCDESSLFLKAMLENNIQPLVHFDLHETTDTDNTVFRPALEARDGVQQEIWDIPDGFYLVSDLHNPQKDFQAAIIESVQKVTHIAPADKDGKIIGEPIVQLGVINYDVKKLFLCVGFSNAKYTTTTEVYPNSPKVTDTLCVEAQIAAIEGGLNYLLNTAR